MKRTASFTRGFTLIELLVVIAIIGVLASIVLASLNSARRKSRDARRITDVKQIQLALELYYDAQSPQQYPAASATCDATTARGLQVLSTGGYIPTVPRDPNASPNCYVYSSPAAPAAAYHLGISLEESTNSALQSDKDCNSNTAGNCGFTAIAGTGFDGTPAALYDVVP